MKNPATDQAAGRSVAASANPGVATQEGSVTTAAMNKSQPNLREAALDRYAEQWAHAIEQTEELQRTFERLTEAGLGEKGAAIERGRALQIARLG